MEDEDKTKNLAEENCRLRDELSQCKDDKEFVWMLWKDLQKQSPDMTSTIDMIITRERLKYEQKNKELYDIVEMKQCNVETLTQELVKKDQEIIQQNAKLQRMQTEITILEQKLKSQQLELEKQTDEGQRKLLKMKEKCSELENKLEEERKSLFIHHEEMKRILSKSEEQKINFEQLKLENETKDLLNEKLKQERLHLKKMADNLSQQRVRHEQTIHRQQEEIQSFKCELSEVSRSRDAWANHTTLQNVAMQQLQKENHTLKEILSQRPCTHSDCNPDKEERLSRGEEDRDIDEKEREDRFQLTLESVENELFETKSQLKAKCTELEGVRCCHDRRMKRMHALQTSQALLEQQIHTYETNSSGSLKANNIKQAPVKTLRHENSTAVWNELALYRDKCKQLEIQLLELEEERDTLKAKFLRSQSCISELRTQLQHEKNDLERKLSAIVKAEESLFTTQSCEEQLKLKVSELEDALSELKHEKATLQSQHRSTEKELFKLREDAAQMQSEIMELTHNKKLNQLQMLTKATMTDEGSSCHYDSSVSVTDSSTQVDCSPLRPDVKDRGVSPIIPPPKMQPPTQTKEASTQTTSAVKRPACSHRRTRSEGDSLFYKSKAREAFKRVKKISRQLQNITQHPPQDGNHDHHNGGDYSAPEMINQSTESRVEPLSLDVRVNSQQDTSAIIHKCTFQQQVKTLQRKLRALNKQLCDASSTRQYLSKSLEDEKKERGKAKAEIKELNVRLQGMRTVVQSLQGEIHRVSSVNQQLQQKLDSFSETRKGRTDVDWKRIESEKRVLSERCSALSESVKSLEEKVQQKTSELEEAHDRFGRVERDLRQKRQLLDSQRDKMKTITQQAAKDKARTQHVENEIVILRESIEQNRRKMETLRIQLSRQKEEKSKSLTLLANCQEELAYTLQQLSGSQSECEGDKQELVQVKQVCERYKQELVQVKQVCERYKQELVQVKQVCEQDIATQQRKHTQIIETVKHQYMERQRLTKEKLKIKEKFLLEHKKFVKELAVCVEHHYKQTRQRQLQQDEEQEDISHCTVVSSRVREIAKSTLRLSDLDIDELFSDKEPSNELTQETTALVGAVEEHITKIPFASNLVQQFMNMI